MSKLVTTGATALFVCILCATPLSLRFSPEGNVSLSEDTASAVIGRPLTPMSVAGVNRRADRRAYRQGYYGYGAYRPYRYAMERTSRIPTTEPVMDHTSRGGRAERRATGTAEYEAAICAGAATLYGGYQC